jgi:2-dehydropantoate 2-reductase
VARPDAAAGTAKPGAVRIAVFGAGAIGGYFGGRLALSGQDVVFIARGRTLRALHEKGLRVKSVAGDFEVRVTATDDPWAVGPCDHVLVCVKSYDTDDVIASLPPLMRGNTAVVSLQNGIDNEEKIAAAIGAQHTAGGAAYIFCAVEAPGVIRHTGGPTRIVLGEWAGERSTRLETFVEACLRAGFGAELSDDIKRVLWSKFAFICAQAGTTAAIRLPIGEIRSAPASREMFRRISQEVRAVSGAHGVTLEADLADRHLILADGLEADGYSSLYDDLTHGRRLELDALHAEVVRRARQAGIPVPMTEAVHAILEPWAIRNERFRAR